MYDTHISNISILESIIVSIVSSSGKHRSYTAGLEAFVFYHLSEHITDGFFNWAIMYTQFFLAF